MCVASAGEGGNLLTGLVGRRGSSWNSKKNNFGPQVGFAWSPASLLGHGFQSRLVIRGGYGIGYSGEEIAISANIVGNPGLAVSPVFNFINPSTCSNPALQNQNCGIVYALSSDPRNLNGYPANTNAISTFGSNGLPTTGRAFLSIFPTDLPTRLFHHYSVDAQYDLGHQFVASLGCQGSLSRNTFFHDDPRTLPATKGFAVNPLIDARDMLGGS